MPDRIVTVSVGENYVRIAEASQADKNHIEVTSLGEVASPNPIYDVQTEKTVEEEAKVISKLYDSSKLKTKNINVVIPDSVSFSQILEMPKLKEKELLSAIKYQADQFIPMPIEETALDLEVLREDTAAKKLLVLIVATPQTLVTKIESLIEKSGLIPDSVENELSATISFLSTFYTPTDTTNASVFVNMGSNSTSLYFFHHGYKMIIDSHTFKLGINLFLKEIMANLNFDEMKSFEVLKTIGLGQGGSVNLDQILKPVIAELVNEIEKFSISMKEKYKIGSIGQVFLFNRAQDVLYLEKKVEGSLSLPTHIFDPMPYIKSSPLVQSNSKRLSSYVATLGGCIR